MTHVVASAHVSIQLGLLFEPESNGRYPTLPERLGREFVLYRVQLRNVFTFELNCWSSRAAYWGIFCLAACE